MVETAEDFAKRVLHGTGVHRTLDRDWLAQRVRERDGERDAKLAAVEQERDGLLGEVSFLRAGIAEPGSVEADLRAERDAALDRMEVMEQAHDVTRGYRQHAEQERDAAIEQFVKLRAQFDDAEIERWQTRIEAVIRATGLEPCAAAGTDPLDVTAEQVRVALLAPPR